MSVKNIAVIGANGFIGKQLTHALSQLPELSLNLFGRSEYSTNDEKHFYQQIDLNNTELLKKQFAEIDFVYYLASESIPTTSWNDPKMEVEKNLLPFINFLECIVTLKVRKIVFVSSAGTIYGVSSDKLREDSEKMPFSPYGITKLAMEHYLNYFEARHSLRYDIYRVSNVYGEGQDTGKGLGAINTFLEKIIMEKKIVVYGDGEVIRNYIYIDDVAKLLAASVQSNSGESNIYNLSSNDTVSINQLITGIKDIVKENFEVVYQETRRSDNPAIDLDNTKIKKSNPDFKFTELKEGIQNTYAFIKTNLKA
jgi:UDP-glucose 4-epimerase